MKSLKYYYGSFAVTLMGLIAAFVVGGVEALFLVAILAVLEVSLSFDNAVVNAKVLEDMSDKWRKRFLTWGILIAVFGMRIVFPVLIVSVIASVSPWEAIKLATSSPELYQKHMTEANVMLMAFGGTFLLRVGIEFFFDEGKEGHWIESIESRLAKLGAIKGLKVSLELSLPVLIGLWVYSLGHFTKAEAIDAGVGFISAFALYQLLIMFTDYMEKIQAVEAGAGVKEVVKGGLATFLYLEVLDASFSFDGVIGAFAITNNIFLIAIGLGIGAMFVRSMTIMLVEKGTLTEYRYLEHGAFYAIIALGLMMLLKTFMHIPEAITGLIGAGFIGAAFVHSVLLNKKEAAAA